MLAVDVADPDDVVGDLPLQPTTDVPSSTVVAADATTVISGNRIPVRSYPSGESPILPDSFTGNKPEGLVAARVGSVTMMRATRSTCTEAHEDGRCNIPIGDPGYQPKLDGDGDGDGIVCEC